MSHTPTAAADLRKVFGALVDEHDDSLGAARQYIAELRERTSPEPARLLARVGRVFTALRISARYLNLGPLREVCEQSETALASMERYEAQLSPGFLDALTAAVDYARAEVRARRGNANPGSAARARAIVRALAEVSHGAAGAIDLESEDFALFAEDGLRLINECRRAVLKGAETEGGEQRAWIDAAFRAAHTLKGNAGLMGLAQLEGLGRAAEQALDALRNAEVVYTTALTIALVGLFERATSGLSTPQDFHWTEEAKQLEHALAEARAVARRTRLGELLVERRLVAPEQIELVLAIRRAPLGEALVRMQALSERDLNHALDLQKRIRQGEELPDDELPGAPRPHTEIVETTRIEAAKLLAHELQAAAESGHAIGDVPGALTHMARTLCEQIEALDHVSLRAVFRKARQAALDTAKRLGKNVELVCIGEDTLAPRAAAEALGDVVLHLVRNAVDHGVEPSAERAQRGKRTSATVALRVYTAGRELCVEVNDDGRGLDRARILAKAVANAMIDAGRAAQLRDEEAFMLVFEPGFSTAEQVSDISGRGVGMDVVRHAVEELGGSVHLRSTLGAGTTVRINLPRVSAPTNAAGFSSPPAQLSSTAVMKTVRYGS